LRLGHDPAQRTRNPTTRHRLRELPCPEGAIPASLGITALGELAIKPPATQPHPQPSATRRPLINATVTQADRHVHLVRNKLHRDQTTRRPLSTPSP
jgi:hypothetical protein